jgi:hypothetical protein
VDGGVVTRQREPAPVEPAIIDRRDMAWRFRRLTMWLTLTELGLSQQQLDALPAWNAEATTEALRRLESQIDSLGLRQQADAHIAHLRDARARWPAGA